MPRMGDTVPLLRHRMERVKGIEPSSLLPGAVLPGNLLIRARTGGKMPTFRLTDSSERQLLTKDDHTEPPRHPDSRFSAAFFADSSRVWNHASSGSVGAR